MTYKILARETRSVLENYNSQTKYCCFGLPDSDKTEYLLNLMSAIDNDDKPYPDYINESILLVGLTAFKNYLHDHKNKKLSDNIDFIIKKHASVPLTDQMQVCVDQAKQCINDYGLVMLVGNFRYTDAHLSPVTSGEATKWPKNLADILKDRDHAPSSMLRN